MQVLLTLSMPFFKGDAWIQQTATLDHDSLRIGLEQMINASTCLKSYYSRQTTPFSMAFCKGAQHDIFVNSNPHHHVAEWISTEQMCNGKRSRTVEPAGWTDLTSPNCSCTAKQQLNGDVRIFD
jgi:hypothetical protein